MRRHHNGTGRRPVIPADWAAHHRPVAEGTMTASCAIRRPGGTSGAFDPETGTSPTVPHPAHHTGPCRVQVLTLGDQERLTADQEVTVVGYLITVEWDAASGEVPLAIGQLVEITAVDDNGDPSLPGRALTIEKVTRGSLAWERDLICTDNLG